ncbi:MAG TPA: nuclear transport factor 2 family protein [Steroidobacteraceae bacterium]
MISIEDRTAISDVISLYGIVIDERQWPLVTALFTDDAVYDITDFNADVLNGAAEIRAFWERTRPFIPSPITQQMSSFVAIGMAMPWPCQKVSASAGAAKWEASPITTNSGVPISVGGSANAWRSCGKPIEMMIPACCPGT